MVQEKTPSKEKQPSRMYARVEPRTLTRDDKGRSTAGIVRFQKCSEIADMRLKHRAPQTKPPSLPKQVVEWPGEPRSTSPVMLPSLLDMVRDNLKLAEALPPDLTKNLEKEGETMVHQYYALKANKVIQHNRNNQVLQQDQKTVPQQNDMSWAHKLIEEKLATAIALVQGRLKQQNAKNEQQGSAAEELQAHSSHQRTQLAQRPCTTQSPHAGLQYSSGSDSGLLQRTSPMTDGRDHDDVEMQSREEHSRLRRATIETVTESEISSRDGIVSEYNHRDSSESALDSDGVIFGFDDSGVNFSDGVALDSRFSEESERPTSSTSAWRDEWALREQGIYYS